MQQQEQLSNDSNVWTYNPPYSKILDNWFVDLNEFVARK